MCGVDVEAMDFCASRLKTLLTVGPGSPGLPPLPSTSSFWKVYAAVNSRPREYRLVSVICNESYQLLPSGAHLTASRSANCGNGRSDCATVAVRGKPGYGAGNLCA